VAEAVLAKSGEEGVASTCARAPLLADALRRMHGDGLLDDLPHGPGRGR